MSDYFDVAVIGAGVVGLAIAQQLAAAPFMCDRSLVVLDQEQAIGQHTSSRNSEVIHAGIYYPAGSLKARLCVRGRHLLYAHCERYQVPHRRTGKLIVASQSDCDALQALLARAQANGVTDLQLIDRAALRRLEDQVVGAAALFSPSSGIVDSHSYMANLLRLAEGDGAIFAPRSRVDAIHHTAEGFRVDARIGTGKHFTDEAYCFYAGIVINCAGLDAVNLARRIDGVSPASIPDLFFCKGDYFSYEGKAPFRHLIYPLPERHTAGLGIHATLDLAGRVRFGPDTEYVDHVHYAIDPEKRHVFAEAIRGYFTGVDSSRLTPDYAGVRPKLAGKDQPAADFLIQDYSSHKVPGLIQLFGIESPGLTASLALGEHVRDLVASTL